MDYPKAVMRVKELEKMGFPHEYLMRSYYSINQNFAWKMNPIIKNSPILFDTAGFEKWRLKDVQMQTSAHEGRLGVV